MRRGKGEDLAVIGQKEEGREKRKRGRHSSHRRKRDVRRGKGEDYSSHRTEGRGT